MTVRIRAFVVGRHFLDIRGEDMVLMLYKRNRSEKCVIGPLSQFQCLTSVWYATARKVWCLRLTYCGRSYPDFGWCPTHSYPILRKSLHSIRSELCNQCSNAATNLAATVARLPRCSLHHIISGTCSRWSPTGLWYAAMTLHLFVFTAEKPTPLRFLLSMLSMLCTNEHAQPHYGVYWNL